MTSRAKKAKYATSAAPTAAAVAGSVQPVYAIRCTRKSSMQEYDEDSFIDCYDEDDHMEAINGDAAVVDGDWLFDAGSDLQHRTDHRTTGLRRSAGTLLVFKCLEEANKQAALVWVSLQANHPFPEAPPEGKRRPDSEDLLEEDDEEEDSKPTKGKRKSSSSSSKAKASGAAASSGKSGKPKSSSAKGKQAAAVDPDSSKNMTADGRACWKRAQRFYVDPWGDDELKNVCSSVLTVEVVEAQLVG